ncbi:MAG: DciA family protein [Pseudomonadota bacterium]|nr:DciA family protein [Pseudomonadota bacterium]
MSIKAKRFRAQPTTTLLDGNGRRGSELNGLMRVANVIGRAQEHLRSHLPEEVRGHLFVGGYRQGKLTLITDRAVWLTWLRYEQARLLELLRQLPELEAVTGLTFKVRPIAPPRVPINRPRALSSQAADELSSCARDTDDPRLKRALERLAAHAEPSTGAD